LFEEVKNIFIQAGFPRREIFDPAKRKNVPLEIGYKDTTVYFGIYLNKPSWWVIRAYVEARKPRVGFNLPQELTSKMVLPTGTILPANSYANFRISIDSIEDIRAIKDIVIAAINHTIQERNSMAATEASS